MADHARYADDFSALWGSQDDDALGPLFDAARAPALGAVNPGRNGAGRRPAAEGQGENAPRLAEVGLAEVRLAEVIASHTDAVQKAQAAAARSELESVFTQQLAVAIHELMAATNDRCAAAESQVGRRIDDLADRLECSVTANADAAAAASGAVHAEVAHLREQLAAPVAALCALHRDVRHDIGRLTDVLSVQAADLARSADANAGALATACTRLSEQVERGEARLAEALEHLGGALDRVAAMQTHVAELQQAVAELTGEVGILRRHRRARGSRTRAE